jgi:hypothetical protein
MCLFFVFFFNLPSDGTSTSCWTVFLLFFFGPDEDFWGMLTMEKKINGKIKATLFASS